MITGRCSRLMGRVAHLPQCGGKFGMERCEARERLRLWLLWSHKRWIQDPSAAGPKFWTYSWRSSVNVGGGSRTLRTRGGDVGLPAGGLVHEQHERVNT